jgi:hypothetical protein
MAPCWALSQNWPTDPRGLRSQAATLFGKRAMIEFQGGHFEREVILWAIRWYVAYPISYRQLEKIMAERGVEVDHATLNRWVLKYRPLFEQEFHLVSYLGTVLAAISLYRSAALLPIC